MPNVEKLLEQRRLTSFTAKYFTLANNVLVVDK